VFEIVPMPRHPRCELRHAGHAIDAQGGARLLARALTSTWGVKIGLDLSIQVNRSLAFCEISGALQFFYTQRNFEIVEIGKSAPCRFL
jgi:hypothetical protein